MTTLFSRLTSLAMPLLLATPVLSATQDVTEAKLLLKTGEPAQALAILKGLVKESPKNGSLNMLIGDCYVAMDSTAKAISAYRDAQKKGENDAWLSLAQLAINDYRIQDAEDDLALYRKGLKKGRKLLPDNSGDIEQLLTRTRNMLDRVEKVVIIDSVSVDVQDFFKYYHLSRDCGQLLSPQQIQPAFNAAEPSVAYISPDGQELIWATEDSAMTVGLVSSSQLYGGEWELPASLGSQLNEGGDANYPFMLNDGVTLYFANDGENSLGGYDIFISRRNDNGEFFQPQNIGMPYNSPYNDYMLAIDEQNGVGWWATDRNHIPGKVTIYTFIPSDMRVNYNVDDPMLASYARIDSYRDTWQDNAGYSALLNRIKNSAAENESEAKPEFFFSVPGRGVLTSIDQFRNREAKSLMHSYLTQLDDYKEMCEALENYRRVYAKGDHSVADDILKLEKQKATGMESLKKLKNQIIKAEMK
ncbi:MAG: tetratricopeptide repeat protein [Muribaculaceae bacterium]|nr:tetratricopeptide repeat protein [Muribaculaceae bacterium]